MAYWSSDFSLLEWMVNQDIVPSNVLQKPYSDYLLDELGVSSYLSDNMCEVNTSTPWINGELWETLKKIVTAVFVIPYINCMRVYCHLVDMTVQLQNLYATSHFHSFQRMLQNIKICAFGHVDVFGQSRWGLISHF